MDKLTYEPIEDDLRDPTAKADLYRLYEEIRILYQSDQLPDKIIQINDR